MKNPADYPPGRLDTEILQAESGDREAGLTLIRLATAQLKQHGILEPDLVSYLVKIFEAVVGGMPGSESAALNLALKKNARSRPKHQYRINEMLLAWGLAQEYPLFERGDISHLRSATERLHAAFGEDVLDAHHAAHSRKAPLERYQIAASIFNQRLQRDQDIGLRNGERPAKASAIKAAVYRNTLRG